MVPSYDRDLRVALSAVHLASLLTKSHLLSNLQSRSQSSTSTVVDDNAKAVPEETKSDSSEVTVADFASQAVLIHAIHSVCPNDTFIAEEGIDMLEIDPVLCDRVWELVKAAGRLSPVIALSDVAANNVDAEALGLASMNDQTVPRLPKTKDEMLIAIDRGSKGGLFDKTLSPGRTWILDPIDGTRTYIKAQHYTVCLCLVDQGLQQVAVLGCPNLPNYFDHSSGRIRVEEGLVDLSPHGGLLVSAVRGQGTRISTLTNPLNLISLDQWLSTQNESVIDRVAAVNTATVNSEGKVGLRFTDSGTSPHISPALHARIFSFFNHPKALDLWSMQMKYVALTLRAVHADAMIRIPPDPDYHASVWDHAGGQLLLTESGGTLTDAKGEAFILDGQTRKLLHNWGVCSVRGAQFEAGSISKQVHEQVLEQVRKELLERNRQTRVAGG